MALVLKNGTVLSLVWHRGMLLSSFVSGRLCPHHMRKHRRVRLTTYTPNSSLKASELSPGTHHFIGTLFRDAGFPPGVLNVIQHRREDAPAVVEALISHPATRKINFTGSTPVGSIVAKLAGQHLTISWDRPNLRIAVAQQRGAC